MINLIIAAIASAFSIIIGWWAQDRAVPILIKSIEVINPVVKAGTPLKLRYHIYRERSCAVHIEQIVYDADGVRFAATDEDYQSAPGIVGEDSFALSVWVPTNVRPGPGTYRAIRSYYCNPLHYWFHWPIVLTTKRIPFEIEG